MVIFAGQGDARRSMALLWRTPGSADVRSGPGPKPGLSVDQIVDAAIEVADRDGMAGLSMRAVGERFGRTAMALYTYVPNKAELLDLMYDRAHAELPAGYDDIVDWRAAVTAWAEDMWAFYLRHPWVLQVSQARPVLGPNEYVVLETLLRILYRTGLAGPAVRRTVGTLFQFVRGTVQTAAEARQARAATGMSDEEWWYARSALLTEVAPDFARRFPTVIRLESERGYHLDDETVPYLEQEAKETLTFGLTILLDGIHSALPE
ncbi:TetR/AcrR family transcriptional regulator [Micromonospora sp. NPDC050397]|uniref:TetR/AcrR family transcriptional regulator n=1 Tax=Micromonospora sp. NPDC050397 TaxID=3364279 RepID=UPI00384BF808